MKKPDHWLAEHIIKSVAANSAWVVLGLIVLGVGTIALFVWSWLSEEITIYRWHYWLLYLVLPSFGVLGLLLYAAWNRPESAKRPWWTDYSQDTFKGIVWRWEWDEDGHILKHTITPFCKVCDRRLHHYEMYSDDCVFRCQANHPDVYFPDDYRAAVMTEIDISVRRQEQQRTGETKRLASPQS